MGVREALKESSSMAELLGMKPAERPVIFYAEDSFTYVQYEGYVESLLDAGRFPLHYVTSDPDDPLLVRDREGLVVRHIDRQLGRFFSKLRGSLVVMTMPDLGQFHIPKPGSGLVLYLFHSLNSTHTAYRTGAFDNYDAFACTGPHHVRELTALRETLPPAELSEVGYYKLDRIARDHASWAHAVSEAPEVLIAPSWGPGNLLEAHGEAIIASLVESGLRVTVRPHPQFFHSLYPAGRSIIEALLSSFGDNPSVEFEMSIDTETSFHRSGVMISDWSGAAFEYALGTLRPAIFLETPQKIFNSDWTLLGLPAFEAYMRDEVGVVIPASEASTLGRAVVAQLDQVEAWKAELEALRERTVFNFGHSGAAGASLIVELVDRL